MASNLGTVWAIDIGNDSLKVLHLSIAGGTVEVIGFDNISHGKILNGSGVSETEKDELIALSLRRFVRENNIGNEQVVISVPSQNSFARFVNLPPVDEKKIPQVVRLEAAMQIPFDMNEVQWDWQLMSGGSGTEARVGIFAIKNEVVTKALEYFGGENVQVTYVQMVPMALYNYLLYDRPELAKSDREATVIINVGAEATDLVVCTKTTVWQRCLTMGGNAFTRAIAETFKLNFDKAEKLKRTAAMSKYARQVFQAMRPVYADLASEIQRSLGFYSNSNPSIKLTKVIALGGGTKLRGLLKYLQQTLQIPVERPDSFKRLSIGSGVSAAKFHENVGDFAVVYGLALQGLGFATIESNLLPKAIAKSMAWASKVKYFTIAASVLLLVSVFSIARTVFDRATYSNKENLRREIGAVIETADSAQEMLQKEESKASKSQEIIEKAKEPFSYRDVIPSVLETMLSVLPNVENNPEQKQLYDAFSSGDVRTIRKIPRKERKQIFVTSMMVYFVEDVETAVFGEVGFRSGSKPRRRGTTGDLDMMGGFGMMGDFDMMGGFGGPSRGRSKFTPRSRGKTSKSDDSAEEKESPGFLVTIAGYSPYSNIGELLDPLDAKDDKSKWGVVTRLLNLDQIVDGNSPFELYERTEVKHFDLKIGRVSLEEEMPDGIGVSQERKGDDGKSSEYVLIDPMTKEVISKVPQMDENGKEKINRAGKVVYEVNDHWFVLKLKLVWRDAPEEPEDSDSV